MRSAHGFVSCRCSGDRRLPVFLKQQVESFVDQHVLVFVVIENELL